MALINYVLGMIHRDEEGQGLAEYALILALIAVLAALYDGKPGARTGGTAYGASAARPGVFVDGTTGGVVGESGEAAHAGSSGSVDGAGEVRIFCEIALPLCRPILVTLAVATFGIAQVRAAPLNAAIALSTDTSILTSVGNDFGFEQAFEKQVQALGRPGDALLQAIY